MYNLQRCHVFSISTQKYMYEVANTGDTSTVYGMDAVRESFHLADRGGLYTGVNPCGARLMASSITRIQRLYPQSNLFYNADKTEVTGR